MAGTEVRRRIVLLSSVVGLVFASPAWAVDGVIEINQARALQGGVTTGDTAGFPVTISVSGSYRLTGNLTLATANTSGIDITADDVSIDLNGFSIVGPITCPGIPPVCSGGGTGAGIQNAGSNTGISVSNGNVQGTGGRGVSLGYHAHVRGVNVRWAGGAYAIYVGEGSIVSGCAVSGNFAVGIWGGAAAVISGNSVLANGDTGIQSFAGAIVTGNTVVSNDGYGIRMSGASMALGNTLVSNTSYGLVCSPGFNGDGYAHNVLNQNNSSGVQVSGCVQIGAGSNLCKGAACP